MELCFICNCRLLGFNGGRLRMDERMDAAMSDMDLVPLLIEVIILHPCFSLSFCIHQTLTDQVGMFGVTRTIY